MFCVCIYGLLLLRCCIVIVLLLLLFCCSPVDDEDNGDDKNGDDNVFVEYKPRIDSNVFVEYKRLCTHSTTKLSSAHSFLLASLAAALWAFVYLEGKCCLCFLDLFVDGGAF